MVGDYCGPYNTLTDVWVNGGVSACFIDTLCPSMGAMILLLASMRFQLSSVNRDVRVMESKWLWLETIVAIGGLTSNLFELVAHLSLKTWAPYGVGYDIINSASCVHTVSGLVSLISILGNMIAALALLGLGLTVDRLRSRRISEGYMKIGSEMPKGESWRLAYDRAKLLLPYVWPVSNVKLQGSVLLSFLLLVVGRFINVLVPIYYKYIVNGLTANQGKGTEYMPVDTVCMYAFLLFLGGVGGGFLANLRGFLWVSVTQYTAREMKVGLFSHLHSMSLQWHLNRKTGEVLRIMDRGTDSVTTILSSVLFNIFPTIVDIIIAVIYFIVMFDALFGVVVLITMVGYMVFTIVVTDLRTKYRVRMNLKDNQARQISVDSLINFETVKYFGAERYEIERFDKAINIYQKEEWALQTSLNYLNTGQNFIISTGLLIGSVLCGYRVTEGRLTAGEFVQFIAYINQLYAPLNFFGTYWRLIQQNVIDMENMFELFEVASDAVDHPNATTLMLKSAPEVSFRDVSFSYGDGMVLKNINFTIPPGQTYAIVGTSGGGKSTLLRLLFRFFKIQEGVITINGQDITKVTQNSLRQAIGVVPQDSVLFNDTIESNILYGRQSANNDEVVAAARAAEMHEKILSFDDGYETVVGERGLRLSGGEKQRIAIARTILKNPHIVLLDEATASLDTETERNIQYSLNKLGADRTSLVVAHRLSTIIGADRILVIQEGRIVEQGSHGELLMMK
eukprot:Ihof_evm7s45 gene=Ihof_evmTU7s45